MSTKAAPPEDGATVFLACALEACRVEALHTEPTGRVALVRYRSVEGVSRVVVLDRRSGTLLGASVPLDLAALSPDGRWIAGSAALEAPTRLWLIPTDSARPEPRVVADGSGVVVGVVFGPRSEAVAELRLSPDTGQTELHTRSLLDGGSRTLGVVEADATLLGWGTEGVLVADARGLALFSVEGDGREQLLEGPVTGLAAVSGTTDALIRAPGSKLLLWSGGQAHSAEALFGIRYTHGAPNLHTAGALGEGPRGLALRPAGSGWLALEVDDSGQRVIQRYLAEP